MLNEKERLKHWLKKYKRPRVNVKGIVSKRKAKQDRMIILPKQSLRCRKKRKGKETTSPPLSQSELLTRNTRRIWWRKDEQNVAQNQQWQKGVEVAMRRLPVTLLQRKNHAVGASQVPAGENRRGPIFAKSAVEITQDGLLKTPGMQAGESGRKNASLLPLCSRIKGSRLEKLPNTLRKPSWIPRI